MEAIASGLEAIALRLEAIASRLETIRSYYSSNVLDAISLNTLARNGMGVGHPSSCAILQLETQEAFRCGRLLDGVCLSQCLSRFFFLLSMIDPDDL